MGENCHSRQAAFPDKRVTLRAITNHYHSLSLLNTESPPFVVNLMYTLSCAQVNNSDAKFVSKSKAKKRWSPLRQKKCDNKLLCFNLC